eukprot:c24225_g1_i1 orf=173-1393(-)
MPFLARDQKWLPGKEMSRAEDAKSFCVEDAEASLIPGLPDDVAVLCLARVRRNMLPKLRLVCSAWKSLCDSSEFPILRRQVGSSEWWIYVLSEMPAGAPFKAFDPQANRWYELPPTPGRSEHECWEGFACVALGSNLLIMGGVKSTLDRHTQLFVSGGVCGDVRVYNACTNRWSTAASMNTPRSWFAAAVIGDHVYVAGGQGKTQFLDSAEIYDPKQDKWQAIPNLIRVRSSCYGVALDGQFWVIGGENMRNQYDDRPKKGSAEVYDPGTCTWRLIDDMWLDSHKVPGPNTVYDGQLLFVHNGKLMLYDKDKNGWFHVGHIFGSAVYNQPFSEFGFACESIDGDVYIIGGRREYWHNHNRYCVQPLNSMNVCNLRSQRQSKFLWWRNAADMGNTEGTILASTVLRL